MASNDLKDPVLIFLARSKDYMLELRNAMEDSDIVRMRDAVDGITDIIEALRSTYKGKEPA